MGFRVAAVVLRIVKKPSRLTSDLSRLPHAMQKISYKILHNVEPEKLARRYVRYLGETGKWLELYCRSPNKVLRDLANECNKLRTRIDAAWKVGDWDEARRLLIQLDKMMAELLGHHTR